MSAIREGQVWRHKSETWRQVTITGETTIRGVEGVNVRRNTSRRTQAIRVETLLRSYRLVKEAA